MGDFEENIKEWVNIDNEIKAMNEKIKLLRERRGATFETIIQHVETNNLKNATINITDGRLKFGICRQTTPLTIKHVETCLKQCITSNEQVDKIIQYIKQTRSVKSFPEIKRSYKN